MMGNTGPGGRLPLPVLAALMQLLALVLAWLVSLPFAPPLYWLAVIQALVAVVLARMFAMPWWWQLIQLIFFPLVLVARALPLGSAWYLAGFLLLLSVGLGAARDRVPLYLTGPRTAKVLLALLPAPHGVQMLDAGAGWGGLLGFLARNRPDACFEGVENAPLSFLIGWLRLAGQANVRLRYADLWCQNLAMYDVVYVFLSPAVMERLWHKAKREMRPGSLLVSNTFVVPRQPADKVVAVGDRRGTLLHLWHMDRHLSAAHGRGSARV